MGTGLWQDKGMFALDHECQTLLNEWLPDPAACLNTARLWQVLQRQGLQPDDPRLRDLPASSDLDQAALHALLAENSLLRQALSGALCVPDFDSFSTDLRHIFAQVQSRSEGQVANYIPQLARVNPEAFGLAVCTIDGQRFSLGEDQTLFSLQSTSKPINYCMVHEELGEARVHQHIGREPSGMVFNELKLNRQGLPHNPLINAGAIMSCALLRRDLNPADRFDAVIRTWQALSGGVRPGFNNAIYLSERQHADRNFALAYFMRENGAFPPETDLTEVLEFYFQCCAMELDVRAMARAAATLANAGICPLTGEKVFSPETIQNVLSLMSSAGMYDFSGEFAFKIGLPAKSGVSGALMVVVPNLMGLCLWSPRLDQHGNSVRGVAFCEALVQQYPFHVYDILLSDSRKKNPARRPAERLAQRVSALIWAASRGDLAEVRYLLASGVDVNAQDYDGRTALHLAAAEGHQPVLRYLLAQGADPQCKDRRGEVPAVT